MIARSWKEMIEERKTERKLILVLFSAAILFAMVREWKAPSACLRFSVESRLPLADSR